jgi:alpha-1,2-mannosyltransferase
MVSYSAMPAGAWARYLRTAGLGAVAAAVSLAVWYGLDHYAQRHGFFDLRIYRSAVRWWLDGMPLYEYVQPHTGGLGFTYPPFAAALMVPLAMMPFELGTALASICTAAAITLTTWWLVAPVAERHGWPRWFSVAVAVPLVCALEPIRETMGFGQVNMLLVGLVLFDVWALRRGYRFAGVAIGLAAAIKLTPAFFVAYLLVTGRRRPAVVAVGTAVVTTLLTALAAPGTSMQFWFGALWQTSRVGRYDYVGNQSWMGLLARLMDPAPPNRLGWLLGVVAIGAFGLWRARRAWLAGDDLAGFTLAGLTAVLLCPISWTHHLYWIVPALVLLVAAAADRRNWWYALAAALAWAAVAGSVIWPFNHKPNEHFSDGLIGVLGENVYVLICLLLVVLLPFRARADAPEADDTGSAALPAGVPVRREPKPAFAERPEPGRSVGEPAR